VTLNTHATYPVFASKPAALSSSVPWVSTGAGRPGAVRASHPALRVSSTHLWQVRLPPLRLRTLYGCLWLQLRCCCWPRRWAVLRQSATARLWWLPAARVAAGPARLQALQRPRASATRSRLPPGTPLRACEARWRGPSPQCEAFRPHGLHLPEHSHSTGCAILM